MTVAVLSWGAEQTLENTLESYARGDLGWGGEKLVLLQDYTLEQMRIADRFGFTPIPLETNVGIAQGYLRLLEAASEEYFLFLENDWKLIEDPNILLSHGELILDMGKADIIRYRHRENPGAPLWTKQFEGREYDRPTHLLDCVHWKRNPEVFPEISISRLTTAGISYDWYFASAKNANWTNNPHMARRDFLLEHLLPQIGRGTLESDLQAWWEQQDFIVAQSDGLFTHERLD